MATTLNIRTLNGSTHSIQVDDGYTMPPLLPGCWVEFQGRSGTKLSVFSNNIEAVSVGQVTSTVTF